MEVNKAFFMSTSYPNKYINLPLFPGTVLHQHFRRFSVLYLLMKLPLISKIAELDPTNNAEELFLPGFMSNHQHSLLLLRNSDSNRKYQTGMPEVERHQLISSG